MRKLFFSEAAVYRLLKAHDLITSPAFVVIKAANEFKNKTTAPNQLYWKTIIYPETLKARSALSSITITTAA
jgi:hypothetical protein